MTIDSLDYVFLHSPFFYGLLEMMLHDNLVEIV